MNAKKKSLKKRGLAMLAVALLVVLMGQGVFAAELGSEPDSAGNIVNAGSVVTLPNMPFFGAMVAGMTVDMKNTEAQGSVMAAGESVNVQNSKVGETLCAAGNKVTIDATEVNGNVLTAGNLIKITGASKANGVYAAGSTVEFAGETKHLTIGAGTVVISGIVNGDADISAENVEIRDGAIINGELRISSSKTPIISENAGIGKYTFNEVVDSSTEIVEAVGTVSIASAIISKLLGGLYWIIAMAAFGMLLCWLFNDHLDRAGEYMKKRTGSMIGSGIVGGLLIPLASLMLCMTVVLAPIGGMLLLAYFLFTCAGLAFAGASIARLVFPKMNVFLSALIGIVILEVVVLIPVLGWIVGAAADMYLIGYVIQRVWDGRLRKKIDTVEKKEV